MTFKEFLSTKNGGTLLEETEEGSFSSSTNLNGGLLA